MSAQSPVAFNDAERERETIVDDCRDVARTHFVIGQLPGQLLHRAANEIERLRLCISDTPTWIACAEQLPKRRYVEEPGFPGISINCLVVDADGDFDVAAYDLEDANWYSLQRATFLSGITHWMPLPEAP